MDNTRSEYESTTMNDKVNSADDLLAMIDATPLCINLWNEKNECFFTNQYAMELFELESQENFSENITKFSPEFQPDGEKSTTKSLTYFRKAREEGYVQFKWVHCKLNGETIPFEITIKRYEVAKDNNILISFMQDLRPRLANYKNDDIEDGFYLGEITERTLLTAISDLSNEWFFAYDINKSTIQFYGRGRDLLGFSKDKIPFPEGVLEKNIIYAADLERFHEFTKCMERGEVKPFDIRFVLEDESIRFYKVLYKIIRNATGSNNYVIGKAVDINQQKSFEVLAKTDLLTNCLNKISSENDINDTIMNMHDKPHTLFIIDVDNFKSINDNFGHHFGDTVLSDVARKLHANFRSGDTIGRIGGDEFIVFLKNISNDEIIINKAQAIAKAFQQEYVGKDNVYKISGSIGIARYPNDGRTYEELYKAADSALYQSKNKGKNCFTFYS